MKNSYREFFAECLPVIKMRPFLIRNRIDQSAFSRFMKGQMFNYEISLDKLQALKLDIMETVKKFT